MDIVAMREHHVSDDDEECVCLNHFSTGLGRKPLEAAITMKFANVDAKNTPVKNPPGK